MKQAKDILAQEPQIVPVQEQNLGDVKGYIAYLNLDWLDMFFAQEGWMGDVQRQEEFIASLQDGLADVMLRQKKGMMLSYSWYDNENQLRRAIEVMPVSAAAVGLQIVTPDVSRYEELKNLIEEQRRVIGEQRCAIEKLQKEVDRLDSRQRSAMSTPATRQVGDET